MLALCLQWALWQPPQWITKCKQVQVSGLCAVPPSVLGKYNAYSFIKSLSTGDISESQSFSGMPSFQPVL